MNGTILFVDDDKHWYETIDDILKDEGYDVIWVPTRAILQAMLESHYKVDIAITNLNLKPSSLVLDGTGYSILEYLQRQFPQLPKIVISSLQDMPGIEKPVDGVKTAKKVVQLYSRYHVDYVAVKGDMDTTELIGKINEFISLKGRIESMNWEDAVRMLVSAMTPYAVALGTSTVSAFGTKFGDAVYDNFKKVWDWMQGNVEQSGGDADKKLWEDFKNSPKDHQELLVKTMLRLVPTEELEIRRQVETLLQETYRLLDNYDIFTLQDLKRICSRLSVHWENEVPNPTSEALSRWAVKYARTRHKEAQLVAAIFEINPDALPK